MDKRLRGLKRICRTIFTSFGIGCPLAVTFRPRCAELRSPSQTVGFGHWEYQRYAEAFGEDLAVIPLPDFGKGSKTAWGSWSWGITASSQHPQAAAQFLEFLLDPIQVLEMTRANSAVPAVRTAIRQSPLYGAGGALRPFAEQLLALGDQPNPRPETPAYPLVTVAFQRAFRDIQNGADVTTALDGAAAVIDKALAAIKSR